MMHSGFQPCFFLGNDQEHWGVPSRPVCHECHELEGLLKHGQAPFSNQGTHLEEARCFLILTELLSGPYVHSDSHQ